MVYSSSPLGAGTASIDLRAAPTLATLCTTDLFKSINHYRLKGPAAIMSISTRAPGELKLLMQIVVLAGRHSPK